MTKVSITKAKLDTLAEAIGGKTSTEVPLTIDQMITAVEGIGGGGSNVFVVTVSWDSTESKWLPDHTYAEIEAAHNAGKTVTVRTDVDSWEASADCEWLEDEEEGEFFYYTVHYHDSENNEIGHTSYVYNDGVWGTDDSTFYNVTPRWSNDLTASGATVTAPAGYYPVNSSQTVQSGVATMYSSISTTGATLTYSTNNGGTISLSKTASITPNVTPGYVTEGTAKSVAITLTASANIRDASDMTVSGDTVTAPAGYYASAATKTVASGTAGTPTASKGTVSNHQVSVTPSVTNTSGYITGSTKTGTAVTVTASELVSGSETKSANGTYDVTNLASLVVAVPFSTIRTGSSTPSSSLGANGDIYLQTS